MIKAGEVAFVKTSGEAVFVLQLEGDVAVVRRPVAGQNGVTHVKDEFYTMELETLEEQRAQFMANQKEMMAKYGPASIQAPSDSDPRFGSN